MPERAGKFVGRPPPDPEDASLFDLCAWALAARSREGPEGGAVGTANHVGKREVLAPGGR